MTKGNAIANPASSIATTIRMFPKLKIMPPSKAKNICFKSADDRLIKKLHPFLLKKAAKDLLIKSQYYNPNIKIEMAIYLE